MVTVKRAMVFLFFLYLSSQSCANYDVNLIGSLNPENSLSRHTSSFADCLYHDCCLKFFNTRDPYPRSPVWYYQKLINKSVNLTSPSDIAYFNESKNFISGMTIYTDSCWQNNGAKNKWNTYQLLSNKSTLNYAYIVVESSVINQSEVDIFNNYFDALIVPDEWIVSVCRASGVTIPIFTLPLILNLKPFLQRSIPKRLKTSFTFGFSGIFSYRKNVDLLIKAFAQEFGNDSKVSLLLHSRFNKSLKQVLKLVKATRCQNISVIQENFTREQYQDFIAGLSSLVLLSKGEGFSIVPREALAAGVPCILSNNTAHTSICESGFVASVPSEKVVPGYLFTLKKNKKSVGSMFDCSLADARKALRDVYERYDYYHERAQQGRAWTQQYLIENLHAKYMSLAKPSKVILGFENKIEDTYLMVSSRALFDKYRTLCAGMDTVFEEL